MAPHARTEPPEKSSQQLWQDRNWYAVYTRPSRECFAAANVRLLGLEVFLPHIRRLGKKRRLGRSDKRALFPGYFFTLLQPAAHLTAVRNTPGVVTIVSSSNQPTPVHEEIIAGLKARLADDGCVPAASRNLHRGDEVTIGDGPFRGLIARFERECDDRARVMLLLQAIGEARVCIDKDCLHSAP